MDKKRSKSEMELEWKAWSKAHSISPDNKDAERAWRTAWRLSREAAFLENKGYPPITRIG